jgi:hypothetical protein
MKKFIILILLAQFSNLNAQFYDKAPLNSLFDGDFKYLDVDNDGYLDLVGVYNLGNAIAWRKNNQNENFSSPIIIDTLPGSYASSYEACEIKLFDIDSDGDLDITFRKALSNGNL